MQEARQPCPPPSLHSPGHLKQCRASETYENLQANRYRWSTHCSLGCNGRGLPSCAFFPFRFFLFLIFPSSYTMDWDMITPRFASAERANQRTMEVEESCISPLPKPEPSSDQRTSKAQNAKRAGSGFPHFLGQATLHYLPRHCYLLLPDYYCLYSPVWLYRQITPSSTSTCTISSID